jgi:predicted cupin superfamily sugar epimerase
VASKLNIQEVIQRLGLKPHPEGGYYAETFRSLESVMLSDGRQRSASTAIYFLLPEGAFSALHRVAADECWHHYGGAPLELVMISPQGSLERVIIGLDLKAGQCPQHVVPSGWWQATKPLDGGSALAGCTVAPGFDFADFEMPSRSVLLALFPTHAAVILEFTYP